MDTGDIALHERLEILSEDTAHSLYQRVLALEEELFREAVPLLISKSLPRISQDDVKATTHFKKDVKTIQKFDLSENISVGSVLRRLRALTTNRWNEAAYFETDENRYYVRIEIKKERL